MNEVILGDCLEKIKDIPDNSIDLIITSPPYDNIENAGLTVAVQPTREGFNDRKLMLQAHRRDTYNPQPTLQVNHTITDSNATIEARKILQGLAINTDYKVIE